MDRYKERTEFMERLIINKNHQAQKELLKKATQKPEDWFREGFLENLKSFIGRFRR